MLRTLFMPLSLAISTTFSAQVLAEHVELPGIAVTAAPGEAAPFDLPESPFSSSDSGQLVKKLPGANINQNGPITSLVQYRGLFADRVNVVVDGVSLAAAGPNRMDSPLSYLPGSQVESISIFRGIAPVSSGMETIGGTVKVNSSQAEYGNSNEVELSGSLNTLYATNGNTRSVAMTNNLVNQHHRLQLSGSFDRGHDLDFDGGDIEPSEHARDTLGIDYGFRFDNTELDVDLNHLDIGHSGTPALPMDIISIRGETVNTGIRQQLANGGELTARVKYQDVAHQMDNFSLRPAGMMQRYNDADVLAKGIQLGYSQAAWQFGFDADSAEHNARISDPTNAMFYVDNFNEVERDRLSAFTEWNGVLNDNWQMQSGLRLTHVRMDAGDVDSSMAAMMMPVATLRDAFNNTDHSQSDTLTELALDLTRRLSDSLDLQLGFARKERAPSYQERYLWLPLEATSGLADGNNYIGNIELDPETAYQFELGLDWHTPRFAITPRLFYHHINDYIQGITTDNAAAIMVSAMMSPSAGTPLQYDNVDAKLYGFDTNWLWAVTDQWQLDGTISYVRGKRRDTDDNLYRIAPLTARTQLSYVQPTWRAGIEAVTVARQNQVSAENDEEKTSGYAIINLSGQVNVNQSLRIQAGVTNLFDRDYQNHLGGYNRVSNDDIAVGERLPGFGRSVYVGLNLTW
jgi:iron complex outermembrane receptor protein